MLSAAADHFLNIPANRAADVGLSPWTRRLRGMDALIVSYHNVIRESSSEVGDRSLHLPRDLFLRQVEWLTEHFEIVPLGAFSGDIGRKERPLLAITFDDAYRGVFRHALPELVTRELTSTVFVPTGCLGEGPFWWDRAAEASHGYVSEETRDYFLKAGRGEQDRIIRLVQNSDIDPLVEEARIPSDCRPVSEGELIDASRLPGVYYASHTVSHPNLTALKDGEIEREISSSARWLETNVSNWIPWLAYPYGALSERVTGIARKTGLEGAVGTTGGWIEGRSDTIFELPRLNVPSGISMDRFKMLVAWLA